MGFKYINGQAYLNGTRYIGAPADSSKSPTETYMEDASSIASGGVDEYAQSSEFIQGVTEKSDALMSSITDSILSLQESTAENMVDVDGMVGTLTESFEANKNNIINSALSSTKKASLELDAYLGSNTSDARSAVRRNVATSTTQGILTAATQSVSSIYSDYTKSVIDTTLSGSQINAATANSSASAIAALSGQASSLLLGSASFVMDGYTNQLNSALALVSASQAQQSLDLQKSQLSLQKSEFNQSVYDAYSKQSWSYTGSDAGLAQYQDQREAEMKSRQV